MTAPPLHSGGVRLAGAVLTGLLLVTGCVAPGSTTPTPTVPAATADSAAPAASTPAPAGSVSTDGSDLEVPDYSGPQPMPASVPGPMLWPTSTRVNLPGLSYEDFAVHGFVDATGKLVVPARYEGYSYCRDAAGQVSFVIATAAGRKADVLDLTGKVIAHAPSHDASCGPSGLVVFTKVFDPELSNQLDGLMEVPSGAILLPQAAGRQIMVINADTVDVTEPKGNYFLNPRTGKRTPHPGWLAPDAVLEPGAPGLPASMVEPNTDKEGLSGYLDLTGTWVVKPGFDDASSFHDGHALVRLDGTQTFLDTGFQRVGGPWDEVDWVSKRVAGEWTTIGYVVSNPPAQALLASDLRVISAEGAATIDCPYDANGACTVIGADRRVSMVVLPEGAVTPMPDGFSRVLGGSFVSDAVAVNEDQEGATKVLALGPGRTSTLDGPSSCTAVDNTWVACAPLSAVLPRVVIDSQGRRTAFATVTAVDDPTRFEGASYYWVVAGKYQGFIDAGGAWRYRESRYTRVEE